MRVVLVGSIEERARLRATANGALRIVGEFPTLEAARAANPDADAILLAADYGTASVRARESGRRAPSTGRRAWPDDGSLDSAPIAPEPLTRREVEVLELLAEGLANKTIAERLGISDQTVKFHVGSIAAKLGAANRTDAVRRAVRRGLITL